MSESFDCPRCGAPMKFDAEQDSSKETITCPYCGESVIVPESLRKPTPQENGIDDEFKAEMADAVAIARTVAMDHPTVITLDTAAPARVGQSAKKWIGTCVVISIITVGILGILGLFAYGSIKTSLTQALNPIKTNPVSVANNQIGTAMAQVTQMIAQVTDMPKVVPPTAVLDTPTPPINITATAGAEATLASYNGVAATQSQWPVVVQEKFINDALNWDVGATNDQYAIENMAIAANKYTWKLTSKKSMGTFSFPDMKDQTDMYVSVDMQMVSNSTYDDDQAGIIFRSSSKDMTFYFFGINPKGNYWLSMYDGNNNGWSDMISNSQSDLIKANQVNHLAISMQGNQILLMINGTVVNSFEDAQLSSGGAGLGMELTSAGVDATAIFSNFEVQAPKK